MAEHWKFRGSFEIYSGLGNEFIRTLLERSKINHLFDGAVVDLESGFTELSVRKVYDSSSSYDIRESMIIDRNTTPQSVERFASSIAIKEEISRVPEGFGSLDS